MALPSSKFYSTKDVAALYNIAPKTVAPWEEQGLIPKAAIHSGRRKLWPKAVIDRHIEQLEDQASQPPLQA